MGGDGYSDEEDFELLFNEDINTTRFNLMNTHVARKINMFINLNPSTDVGSDYTNIAKQISDEMLMTLVIFFKESSMENPPEFVHFKLPHFTPDHIEMLNNIKILSGHVGDAGSYED